MYVSDGNMRFYEQHHSVYLHAHTEHMTKTPHVEFSEKALGMVPIKSMLLCKDVAHVHIGLLHTMQRHRF